MTVTFVTLGCKVNQYDTQRMRERFIQAGYEVLEEGSREQPDVAVLNSCTVTAESDRKSRQALRRLRRQYPHAVVILTGCMAQAFRESASELMQADVVVGNSLKPDLPMWVDVFAQRQEHVAYIPPFHPRMEFEEGELTQFSGRTRAYVKIEDGCNRLCTYCVVPRARGQVRSRPLDSIEREVRILAEQGAQEVVLVGINLSAYGQDFQRPDHPEHAGREDWNLCDAVEAACAVEGITRVRLGSLEPDQITPDMIDRLAQQPKLCPQFHLSLQTGCDKTLRAMRRRYDTAFYRALVEQLRARFAGCAITTDVMVGFPGETDEDFRQSLDFVRSIGFARCHVFPYSRRSGTPADEMPSQIPQSYKQERSAAMMACAEQSARDFAAGMDGQVQPVLFETRQGECYLGHTPNYVGVTVSSQEDLRGKIRPVLLHADGAACTGEEVR